MKNRRHGSPGGAEIRAVQKPELRRRENRERERALGRRACGKRCRKKNAVQTQEPRRGSGDGTRPACALREKSMGNENEKNPGLAAQRKETRHHVDCCALARLPEQEIGDEKKKREQRKNQCKKNTATRTQTTRGRGRDEDSQRRWRRAAREKTDRKLTARNPRPVAAWLLRAAASGAATLA
jgi:hypothetical protein